MAKFIIQFVDEMRNILNPDQIQFEIIEVYTCWKFMMGMSPVMYKKYQGLPESEQEELAMKYGHTETTSIAIIEAESLDSADLLLHYHFPDCVSGRYKEVLL